MKQKHSKGKKNNSNPVKEYYNTHIGDEDQRLENNEFEMPITLKYIDKYINPGDKVLDIACGTGKYAQELLKRKCKIGLNDLSDKNMALTKKRLGNHPNILHTEVSDALESGIWEKEKWDGILLLGPLYHMVDLDHRLALLNNARQSVKKEGFIFAAFMSRTAALLYGLKNNPDGIDSEKGAYHLWETGTDEEFIEGTEWFVNSYFSLPEEINPLIKKAGLHPKHLAGIEGIFGENMHHYHTLNKDLQGKWMDFIMEHCEDIHFIHMSKHLLSISQKQ